MAAIMFRPSQDGGVPSPPAPSPTHAAAAPHRCRPHRRHFPSLRRRLCFVVTHL